MIIVVAVTLAACSGASSKRAGGTSTPSSAAIAAEAAALVPSGPVSHAGRWLTDAAGRVLLFHGVNVVAKEPPYEPGADGFSDDHAAWLAANGFRVVRLGIIASGLMPQPGRVDEAYIAKIAAIVDMLHRHGIYALLDLHQDGWGPSLGLPGSADGFPAWMTVTRGAADIRASFPQYYIQNPAIQAAFQSFWDNAPASDGTPLQSDYAKMFAAVAARFAGNPAVLGYDIFNEPWPGTTWQPCLLDAIGCPTLDQRELGPAYGRATNAIRSAGDRHLVFGEPFVLFNFGTAMTHMPLPGGDGAWGMSFHLYASDPAKEPDVLSNATTWSATTGGALLNTEWGATTDAAAITRQADELDGALLPWTFWSYCCEVVRSLAQPPAADNLVASTVGALVRPYALAVAGTPTRSSYDASTRTLTFTWSTRPARGGSLPAGAVTSFEAPATVYPRGYGVKVTGGTLASDCRGGEVAVRADAGATTVTVTIAPETTCG